MRTQYFYYLLIFFLILPFSLIAQNSKQKTTELNIYDKDGVVNSDEQGLFHYLISIKSKDTLFQRDGYKFIIDNRKGFNEYVNLEEVGQKFSMDTIKCLTISDLEKFSACELHNFLSSKKSIFLTLGPKNKNSSGERRKIYTRYPLIYKGTQKNIEMMENDF
ncbi:hypothetical protein LZ575_05710 [Antarcticibacterium sp. 1MA-6-2]|uniref:hypothetical protein n=1 Tax=Antarcticibacterium sp. 1MA-6-2 TaxID=2908210 RepID=UPI001F185E48|nr:hypothetical protein [Antarcticibacterium sp. 1MA-6-2]UJH92096.1 hypothetical protein LZ575_05710 [Antarcticibacterium sp. 1MA-6-2]